ncbi:hypothetical protein JQS43_10890 [Natronosporangium hydrolyticum]|uniref:Uncharacterized protein n=1 Tax=Natronosporangium hydrolyticum TaxID=2811111 RepID=A0A895YN50_9ACTN|nr:hypothetical protein [Natronosporangium hydrolyticum]QSB16733.1 hypothetical protein JQS43_10890 [Natronosporangium hydrolyticum]
MSGPKVGDAFGEALLAVLRSGEKPGIANEIVERDDGFISATDAIRYFGSSESFSAPVRWALGHAHGRVLDVGSDLSIYDCSLARASIGSSPVSRA